MIDDSDLLLLAARLRSRGTAAAVGETFVFLGGDPALDTDTALAMAAEDGLVRSRGEESRWSLTGTGTEMLADRLAVETDAVGREQIAAAHAAFLPINRAFLASLAASVPAARRASLLSALVIELDPILDSLGGALGRFAGYPARFRHALTRAETDPRWLESPGVDSIHTIWFELHEHLLATLGLSRITER